jgi:hypothetical protein
MLSAQATSETKDTSALALQGVVKDSASVANDSSKATTNAANNDTSKKAGTILATAPYATKPAVGMNPVELFGSESPIGSSGRNIHFGNAITEVHPKPSRLGGKLGVAAALASGTGAASAGELRQAAGDVAESFLPLGLTPSALNTNENEELAKRRKKPPTISKARGGFIDKPIKGGNKDI